MRADSTITGVVSQPRRPAEHVDSGHVGQAEVQHDDVGPVVGGSAQRFGPGGGGGDLVAAHRQVDPQARRIWGSSSITSTLVFDDVCRPPSARPGRSRRSARRPGCRSRQWCRPSPRRTRGDGKAEADTDAVVVVAEALERFEQLLFGTAGMPGPSSVDVDQHAVSDLARVDPHQTVGGVPQRVVDRLTSTRSKSPLSAITTASSTSTLTRSIPSRPYPVGLC